MDNSRQDMLVTNACPVTVIGAGSIGSHLAVMLAHAGFNVKLFDPDDLYPENIAGGMFDARMVTRDASKPKAKVASVASLVNMTTGEKLVEPIYGRFPDADPEWTGRILLSGVDSMDGRKQIWEWIKGNAKRTGLELYVDGRIGGHSSTVLIVNMLDPENIAAYESSLRQPPANLPCGMKSTGYVCSWCASTMTSAVIHFTNNGVPMGRVVTLQAQDAFMGYL